MPRLPPLLGYIGLHLSSPLDEEVGHLNDTSAFPAALFSLSLLRALALPTDSPASDTVVGSYGCLYLSSEERLVETEQGVRWTMGGSILVCVDGV